MLTDNKLRVSLIRWCVLGLLVLATSALLNRTVDALTVDENEFFLALRDKEKLLARTPGPRLIIVGGSNNLFGIDSDRLEKDTGWHVVNASLHAGLGLDYALALVEPFVHQGDAILISPEYFLGAGELPTYAKALVVYPEIQTFLEQSLSSVDRARIYVMRTQESLERAFAFAKGGRNKSVYLRENINSRGDMVGHLNLPKKETLPQLSSPDEANYEPYIRNMKEFSERARARGAMVVFAYPAVCRSEFERHHQSIRHFQSLVETLEVSILNAPETFVFSDEKFFDTAYHLGREGRQQRTVMLADLLKQKSILPSRSR